MKTNKDEWSLQEIVDQLEKCKFQTGDTLHDLEMNVAFVKLKEKAKQEDVLIKTVILQENEIDQYKLKVAQTDAIFKLSYLGKYSWEMLAERFDTCSTIEAVNNLYKEFVNSK